MVVAPFRDSQERILGAIGVIGPTRLNYARIIPLVDYTARTIGRMVGVTVAADALTNPSRRNPRPASCLVSSPRGAASFGG